MAHRGTETFAIGDGRVGQFHALASLDDDGGRIGRLPRSIRVLLEAVLRAAYAGTVPWSHVEILASWEPHAPRTEEVAFVVNRILLPDSGGVPLLADLVALRSEAERLGADPALVEPLIPVDFVIDHSVQIDHAGTPDAFMRNIEVEFARNQERFGFTKWGSHAFRNVSVVPPGVGICHQINLEQLARVVWTEGDLHYFDVMIGADSHTTMVNGVGVLAWGVGGIEAEAAMLGQPSYLLVPDVVGVELTGSLPEGVTSTDLVLAVTERLRAAKVVGKFVEFFGEGAAQLSVPERATLSNMVPEYGATVGYFSIDDRTLDYLRLTGRTDEHVASCAAFARAQGMFGTPMPGECDYSGTVTIDLSAIQPAVAGPRRPQDRVPLHELAGKFRAMLAAPVADGGYGKPAAEAPAGALRDGDVLLAAITSCTNTSNPVVMTAAGLLARNAEARGLRVMPWVKTSFAPGSHAVKGYLARMGLMAPLEALGFGVAAYGCTTCLGNSGPLDAALETEIAARDVVSVAVLSGNRNFEGRVHPSIRANFLASPPLVVAFALAGRATIDFAAEPLGTGTDGTPVFLRDIWPSSADVADQMHHVADPGPTQGHGAHAAAQLWEQLPVSADKVYHWPSSTYIVEPPFVAGLTREPRPIQPIQAARALAILGDSVTTDHISPAGAISPSSEAGRWLRAHGIAPADFNSYAARRSNYHVMARATFGSARIVNQLADGAKGPVTRHMPSGEAVSIFEAATRYRAEGVPLLVFAGKEYGTGSSRDWAAKGPFLLGVRAVVAQSFERLHRSNLIGMGILPLQFQDGVSADSLGLDGTETFDIDLPPDGVSPTATIELRITKPGAALRAVPLLARIDGAMEAEHFRHGGLLPFVLRSLIGATPGAIVQISTSNQGKNE